MSQKLEIWVTHIKDTHISHEHLQDISLHMGEIKKGEGARSRNGEI